VVISAETVGGEEIAWPTGFEFAENIVYGYGSGYLAPSDV